MTTLTQAQLNELHEAMNSEEMMDWKYYNQLRQEEAVFEEANQCEEEDKGTSTIEEWAKYEEEVSSKGFVNYGFKGPVKAVKENGELPF